MASALAVTAAACGPLSRSSQASSSPTAVGPPAGAVTAAAVAKYDTNGQFTLGVGSQPANWNVLSAAGAGPTLASIVDGVLPSVFRTYPDRSVHLDRTFVRSATETSTSPQTVVYQINPKAVWADGTPITYRDFVYNWEAQSGLPAYRDKAGAAFTPTSRAGYRNIASVAQTNHDPYAVTVVFARAYGDWKSLFSDLLPAHLAPLIGFDRGYTDPVTDLVSGGPFLVQSYRPGTSLTLVRNPRYWGPPAALASVSFDFFPNPSRIVPALANDDLQGTVAPLDLVAPLRRLHGLTLDVATGFASEQLDFNQANPWLHDPAVRQAITLAVDRKALIAATVGRYDPGLQPLGNRFFVPGQAGYRDNSGGRYAGGHLSHARSVLAAAGYRVDASGQLTKGGQPVTLRITASAGHPIRQSVERYLVAALRHLGIGVVEADTTAIHATLAAGHFDLAVVTMAGSVWPSRLDSTYQAADAAAGTGRRNYVSFSDPRVDALLAQARGLPPGTPRTKLYNQVDATLWADHYNLPLFQRPALVAFASRYSAIRADPASPGVTYDIGGWALQVGT